MRCFDGLPRRKKNRFALFAGALACLLVSDPSGAGAVEPTNEPALAAKATPMPGSDLVVEPAPAEPVPTNDSAPAPVPATAPVPAPAVETAPTTKEPAPPKEAVPSVEPLPVKERFSRKEWGDRVTTAYGVRRAIRHRGTRIHQGIDVRAASGAGILAFHAGTVVRAETNGGYGICVDVRQDNGMVARYAHLSKMTVTYGQRVNTGDKVGEAGETGHTRGSHLHFELIQNGNRVDPLKYVAKPGQIVRESLAE